VADQVTYGGQAVIEGVMMRGPRYFAVACRRADGTILVRQEQVPAFFTRYAWARWPFLRGIFALADSLVLGMKALLFSANLAVEDEQKQKEQAAAAGPLVQALLGPLQLMLGVTNTAGNAGGGSIGSIAVTGSAVFGMAMGIGLFMLFPSVAAGWLVALAGLLVKNGWEWLQPVAANTLSNKLFEGAIRVALVLGYIALIGRMKHVQRLFKYHAAEHQAINAWETEGRLDVDAAMRASRIHPRCGTNFVLIVLLVKALIFTILPWQSELLPRLGLRLVMLPVVASLAYEVIRLAGKYRHFAPLQWIVAPGLMTQYLTTRETERPMVEVAVASLRGVMESEGTLDRVRAEEVPAIA
jgi:uncharacterized protein YqhQ